jgi:hypothetical protein
MERKIEIKVRYFIKKKKRKRQNSIKTGIVNTKTEKNFMTQVTQEQGKE